MKCTLRECNKKVPDNYGFAGFPNGVLINADGDFCCSEECASKYRKQRDKEMDFICTASDREFMSWMLGHFEIG